jgi:DNA-binding NarL/FixJ family response regulator
MTRIFLADSQTTERIAIRLLLMDFLKMEVVGESANWSITLALAPIRRTDMLLVDWNLLPNPANVALEKFREAAPAALAIVLFSPFNTSPQVALSSGADVVINKVEMSKRVVERLLVAAESLPSERWKGLEELASPRGAIVGGEAD